MADEQKDMMDRYLERGTMYVLVDDGVQAEGMVTDGKDSVLELQNIAVVPAAQCKGYGKRSPQSILYNRRGATA